MKFKKRELKGSAGDFSFSVAGRGSRRLPQLHHDVVSLDLLHKF
jgi:hypothetical protein